MSDTKNTATSLVTLVSPNKKFVLSFPSGAKRGGKLIVKPVMFNDHFARMDKLEYEKYFAGKKLEGRRYAIEGSAKHQKDWLPDSSKAKITVSKAELYGVPTSDLGTMNSLIEQTDRFIKDWNVSEEEVTKSGLRPYEYVVKELEETKAMRNANPKAVALLWAEAEKLGLDLDEKISLPQLRQAVADKKALDAKNKEK